MSFNKAFKKRHKLLNPKRALLIFALPLAGRIHNFHKAYPVEGDREGERECDLARNLHLQHCKRSRAAELRTIRVYALGAHTVLQKGAGACDPIHSAMPSCRNLSPARWQPLEACAWHSAALTASEPPLPSMPPSLLPFFLFIVLPSFPPKSTRFAYLNNARQVATALLGLYFVWLRCAAVSAATHQDTFGHILPPADWLWLTIRRFYIEFMLCLDLPCLDLPCLDSTLHVAVIKCAD